MSKEVDTYKIFRELEAREKRANPYKFYDKDELIDEILKNEDEIERLNNIIEHTDSWIDRTIEVIKQQPSEDDTWILERLNGIKQCLKGSVSNE